MPRTRLASVVAPLALLTATLASSVAVAAPSFTLVPGIVAPQGTNYSRIRALSADGRSAAGSSNYGGQGFLWTAEGGRNDFGTGSSGGGGNDSFGISGDGLTVVGRSVGQAFRWSQATGHQILPFLPGFTQAEAKDANHDGSVIVGTMENGGGGSQAFRWTQAGGMQGLGGGTRAQAISGDGTVIVGLLGTGPSAFSWTQAGGLQTLTPLGGTGNASAAGTNVDGSIIVGRSGVELRATMWMNGTPTDLTGGITSMALSPGVVSDDGSVVAGQLSLGPGGQFAGIWTQATGMMKLSDYLVSNGVVLPAGVQLEHCLGISSDGQTFAGYTAFSGSNGIQGFVATIPPPCPADLDNDGSFLNGPTRDRAVTIDDLLYFLTGFEMGSTLIDLDNGSNTGARDNAVTIDDLLYFLTHFEAGC